MPTEAQMEQMALDRLQAAFDEVYKLHEGDLLDASIERWLRTLALYDRERESLFGKEPGEAHRWVVSPAIALRTQFHLEGLLERRKALKEECMAIARQIVTEFVNEMTARAESLCPSKETAPATQADSRPTPAANHAPAKGGSADAAHIAA
jgi:hypothetical protein